MDPFDTLIDLYENQLRIPINEKCRDCDSQYKQPLLPWQIGSRYSSEKGGIFIAGKPHRGVPGILRDSKIIDGRDVGKNLFFNESWPYWSYTKDILTSIFGTAEEGWEHITFSNIVKCSSTDTGDKTSWRCANQCIKENKVIFKEIELLKPRKIIFFTWSMYKELLNEVPFSQAGTMIEHTNINYRRKCGAKQLGWWDRSLTALWGTKVDFLVLGHPQLMKKVEYVEMVCEWLKNP